MSFAASFSLSCCDHGAFSSDTTLFRQPGESFESLLSAGLIFFCDCQSDFFETFSIEAVDEPLTDGIPTGLPPAEVAGAQEGFFSSVLGGKGALLPGFSKLRGLVAALFPKDACEIGALVPSFVSRLSVFLCCAPAVLVAFSVFAANFTPCENIFITLSIGFEELERIHDALVFSTLLDDEVVTEFGLFEAHCAFNLSLNAVLTAISLDIVLLCSIGDSWSLFDSDGIQAESFSLSLLGDHADGGVVVPVQNVTFAEFFDGNGFEGVQEERLFDPSLFGAHGAKGVALPVLVAAPAVVLSEPFSRAIFVPSVLGGFAGIHEEGGFCSCLLGDQGAFVSAMPVEEFKSVFLGWNDGNVD